MDVVQYFTHKQLVFPVQLVFYGHFMQHIT